MNIMEKMENVSYTENGAKGYKSTGKKLVDLNFKIPSFRDNPDRNLFVEALEEDENLALRWLLYLRDVREGVGERSSFRDFVNTLIFENKELGKKFLQLPLEEYGRWDDYIAFLDKHKKDVEQVILDKIISQLEKDEKSEHPSLLAKWLPSINASSVETRKMAGYISKKMELTPKEYRKLLVKLRKKIDIVESKMSANEWSEIDYEKVPSKANINYRNAFMAHDPSRREEYLESLNKGKKKINANAMFMHDIVHAYFDNGYWNYYSVKEYDETLEQLWKAQKKVKCFKNTMVVRDGSGSMITPVGNSSVTAIDVANAITLYCAENMEGEYKDYFVTFSDNAECVKIPSACKTLKERLEFLQDYVDYSNTNIESVFNLLLDNALKNKVSQEDMPESILIISDQEFYQSESCAYGLEGKPNYDTLFKTIGKVYKENGYKLPKVIFWNVNSRTNTIPMTENENGVILLSGFSKNLMSMVMSSEVSPYEALVKELKKSRYDIVDTVA